ncbi:DUF4190 domain-containing protein [Microbacterium paraoxydans]|uniref:DUF4190 domain-containing protein n=1 Tax=Microbacterium paraoxydans TaxID=199592 RepID=UPI001CFA2C65|nr:DUF4190 domain-containing protein [Microbacterium paraoxydans]
MTFPTARMNPLSTVSLVAGIISLALPLLGSIVALTTGYLARRDMVSLRQRGRQRTAWGIALGWVSLAVWIIVPVIVWAQR